MLPDDDDDQRCHGNSDRIVIDRMQIQPQGMEHAEEIGRHLGNLQPQKILQLGKTDQYGNAVGKPDDHRHRDETYQRSKLKATHQEEQDPGHGHRNDEVGKSVTLDDAINDNDESACWSANLYFGAAEHGDQETGNDCGEDAGLGRQAAGDGKSHGQWQCHDANG